jgi:hypothetical protein
MVCILEEKSTFVSEASEKKRASNLALILSGNLLFGQNFFTPELFQYIHMYQLEKNTLLFGNC